MKRSNWQDATPDHAPTLGLSSGLLEKIDLWAQTKGVATQTEAIQLLLEIGLSGSQDRADGSDQRARAATLAEEQIDRMGDASATVEERADRKMRLTSGPSIFRDVRRD